MDKMKKIATKWTIWHRRLRQNKLNE